VRRLLESLYGTCRTNYRFDWPAQLSKYQGTPIFGDLERIVLALRGHRGHTSFVRSDEVSACDFFVPEPSPGFILEYDESQHFTRPRELTLLLYPDVPLRFSRDRWVSLCIRCDARLEMTRRPC